MSLTHNQIWTAIDRLAARAKLTASGLAKKAGLDPTTFNKSKRITPEGRPRWPGQRGRPSGVMRLDLLKVVGSRPAFLARPEAVSLARAASRSMAVHIWLCVSDTVSYT